MSQRNHFLSKFKIRGAIIVGLVIALTAAANDVAGPDGEWRVNLPKFPAHSNGRILRVEGSGGTKIERCDVVVGEVWFFCGPSNIYWPVARCSNAQSEIAAADFPAIRFFMTPKNQPTSRSRIAKGSGEFAVRFAGGHRDFQPSSMARVCLRRFSGPTENGRGRPVADLFGVAEFVRISSDVSRSRHWRNFINSVATAEKEARL